MLLLPHFIILWVLSDKTYLELYWNTSASRLSVCFRILLVFLYIITFCLLHIMPFIPRRDRKSMSFRVKIMYGGRRILKFCFWGILAQLLVYLTRLPSLVGPPDASWPLVMIADGVFAFFHFYLLLCAHLSISVKCLPAHHLNLPEPWHLEKDFDFLLSVVSRFSSASGKIPDKAGL